MNFLYTGGYRQRFNEVINQLKDLPPNSKILELCFGDTHIASFCRKHGYGWKGLDLNRHFVNHAKVLGFDAAEADLMTCEVLPQADVCIMIGSFYHFHSHASLILHKMLVAAKVIILSEPVSNLSSSPGILGFFAKRAGNAGKGDEIFRYDTSSFMNMLKENSMLLNFKITSSGRFKKDLIIKLEKNGSD